jgi:uncharacterized protein involved in copper resistance
MLPTVKLFRVLVLLLLVLLLPVRGVVASTMVCAGMDQTGGLVATAGHAHQGLHGADADASNAHHPDQSLAHSDHHAHDPADNAMDHAADSAPEGATSDTCHLCASGCGVAALLTAFPGPLGAAPAALTRFPGVAMPPLDFQLDGQDRPPRTL